MMTVDDVVEKLDVFMSYSRTDAAQVEILATRLTEEGGLRVWIDRARLQPGSSWRAEIETAMNSSDTAMIIWGAQGLGRVQLQERDLAYVVRDERNDFRVLNVLLPDSQPPQGNWANVDTWIRFQSSLDEPDVFAQLVAAIKGQAPPTPLVAELPDEPAPYRGLEAFGKHNARLFFGRTSSVDEMLARLPHHPFLAVLGPSGSGKTSIVQAGLLASVQSNAVSGSAAWPCQVVRPGPQPLRSLATALARLNPQTDPLTAADAILQRLTAAPATLSDVIQASLPMDGRLVLVVDRLEELFTLCQTEEERRPFVDALVSLVHHPHGPAWTVTTMRADFYGHLGRYAELAAEVVNHQIYLKPMTPEDVAEVIEAPAAQVGALFEKGLAGQVRTDTQVRGEVALPLLQHTLDLLWRKRRGRWLTWDAYQEVGGVSGALRYHADQVIEGLNPAEREVARRLFIRLLWLEEGAGTMAGRRVDKAALADQSADPTTAERILQDLADARLVVLRSEGDQATAELVHDTLPLHWDRLREWVQEDREFLLWRQRLRDALAEWERTGHDAGVLLRGALLTEAARWLGERPDDLTPAERTFIQESVTRQALETAAIERRKRRITYSAATAAVVFMALAAVALLFWRRSEEQRQVAEQQRDMALRTQSRRLADLSLQQTAAGDATSGILLALEALPKDMTTPQRPYIAQAEAALYQALLTPRASAVLDGHTAPVRHSAFGGDGSRLVSASDDHTARLWNASDGTMVAVLRGHDGPVRHAAFSSDDRRLVTASEDGTARLWNARDGSEIAVLHGHEGPVSHAAFSPNGQRLLTASRDHTARLWDGHSGTEVAVLRGHEGSVGHAAFNADGRRLATASSDGTARLWNVSDGSEIAVLRRDEDVVSHVAFSPDGERLATASSDGTIRLWNATDGTEITVLRGHKGPVTHAAFSPDGGRLVSASEDSTARLWNAGDGSEIAVLRGHRGWVEHVAFSPDGDHLVTASSDRTARLWDVTQATEVAVLGGHRGAVEQAAFSPDGRHLVTASSDGTVRLWDATRSSETTVLRGHAGTVRHAVLTADGQRIVTAASDQTARLWDASKGTEIAVLGGHTDVVWAIAFSEAVGRIATASSDGTARLWDASNGTELAVLKGHGGPVTQVVFNPDGTRVATASEDGTARLWETSRGTETAVLDGHKGWVNHVTFSPDGGRVATASNDSTARLWDVASGTELAVLHGHEAAVWRALFSPDGKRLMTASEDGTARLWDAGNGREIAVLRGHKGPLTHITMRPGDGRHVLTASEDGTARLWDAVSGREIAVLRGHRGPLTHVTFRPGDGRRILTASEDGTARLWDAVSGTEIAVLHGHAGVVWYAAFHPDGSRVVTALNDGTARVFTIFPTTQAMIDHAVQLKPGTLSTAQREKFFISTP